MVQEYGNTIKEPCTVTWANTEPKLLGKKTPPIVRFIPNNTQWIRFSWDGGKTHISYGPETLKAVDALSARFLQILNTWNKKKSINIVEHLISCLMALKITDIDIETTRRIPIVEAGSSWYFNTLKDSVVQNPNRIVNNIQVNDKVIDNLPQTEKVANQITRNVNKDRSIEYKQTDCGLERKITIQKDSTLIIEVQRGRHHDVMDIEEKTFSVNFWDQQEWFEKHMAAKPIARTQKILPYILLQIFSKMTGSKAIWPKNYTMIYPRSTKEKVRNSMEEQYRSGHNEYLAHTAVCDFPAELYTVLHSLWWVTVDCKFSLSDTNHTFRMNVINQIITDGLFTIQK